MQTDLADYAERFPAEFAASTSLEDFATRIGDITKPSPAKLVHHWSQQGPESYAAQYFRTLKSHGFVGKALMMPEAHKVADIIESAGLSPFQTGGRTREEGYATIKADGAFVSCNRSHGFAFFGSLGASYQWSDRFKPGEVRSQKGGASYLTRAKPVRAVLDAWGYAVGQDADEWLLATFEAVQREDGRTLVIARSYNGYSQRWLALLDAGESLFPLFSDHERGEIEAEAAKRLEAFGAPA